MYLVRDKNNGLAAAAPGAAADVYQEPVGDSLSSGSILWGNEQDSSENHSGSTSSTGSAGVGGSARDEFIRRVRLKNPSTRFFINPLGARFG